MTFYGWNKNNFSNELYLQRINYCLKFSDELSSYHQRNATKWRITLRKTMTSDDCETTLECYLHIRDFVGLFRKTWTSHILQAWNKTKLKRSVRNFIVKNYADTGCKCCANCLIWQFNIVCASFYVFPIQHRVDFQDRWWHPYRDVHRMTNNYVWQSSFVPNNPKAE